MRSISPLFIIIIIQKQNSTPPSHDHDNNIVRTYHDGSMIAGGVNFLNLLLCHSAVTIPDALLCHRQQFCIPICRCFALALDGKQCLQFVHFARLCFTFSFSAGTKWIQSPPVRTFFQVLQIAFEQEATPASMRARVCGFSFVIDRVTSYRNCIRQQSSLRL